MKQVKTLLVAGMIMAAMVSTASAAIIIDNEDATGYSSVAASGVWAGKDGEYGANYQYLPCSTGTATYEFSGLDNGSYDVFATWRDGHTAVAYFNITPGGGSSTDVTVNMQANSAGDLVLVDGELENVDFQKLATVAVADGTLAVELTGANNVSPYFCADAVALVAVPEPATLGLLGIGGLVAFLKKRR